MMLDPPTLRAEVIAGWQHLNLSHDSVMGALNYETTGDPYWLPPVLADRRETLLPAQTPDDDELNPDIPLEQDVPDWDRIDPRPPVATQPVGSRASGTNRQRNRTRAGRR